MQHSVRTSCGSGPWTRLPKKSRWAPWISCLLAVIIGSIAQSACAGSESSIGSAIPVLPSGPEPLRSSDPQALWAAEGSFWTVKCSSQPELVSLRSVGPLRSDSAWNFVIAHGLGGMVCGDRFCQLAIEIKRKNPDANVLLMRHEDLIGPDQLTHVARLMEHADIRIPREELALLLESHSFQRLSGRQRGQEDVQAHYRKGIAGDWRNHWTDAVERRFMEVAGNVAARWNYA